jgi:hypothetical protein
MVSMSLLRRGVFFLCSVLLMVGLVGLAFAISSNQIFANQAKVQDSLTKSGFYTSFANVQIDAAKSEIGAGPVAFNSPVVQQAAHDALSTQYLRQQGDTFLKSNYAWLEGKAQAPDFRIDLASARTDFAKRVGDAASAHLASLPACTKAQMAQFGTGTIDPLAVSCLPTGIDPQTEGAQLSQDIAKSSPFLNDAVITPQSLDPSSGSQTDPYYKKLSFAPKLYQYNLKAPYIFGGIVLLMLLALYVLAVPKRKATRRLAVVLTVAGIILVLNKILADIVFNALQKQALSAANGDQLQKSLLDFTNLIESQLVRIDLYFGVAFLVVAGMLFVFLWRTKASTARKPAPFEPPISVPAFQNQNPKPQAPSAASQTNYRTTRATTAPELPRDNLKTSQPRKRKPPTLIQ